MRARTYASDPFVSVASPRDLLFFFLFFNIPRKLNRVSSLRADGERPRLFVCARFRGTLQCAAVRLVLVHPCRERREAVAGELSRVVRGEGGSAPGAREKGLGGGREEERGDRGGHSRRLPP